MMILKVKTENAARAEIFEYRHGKRQRLEAVTMQEVNELSKAGRLHMFTGNEVAALADPELFTGLENHSYYTIQPISV